MKVYLNRDKNSAATSWYEDNRERIGSKKAKIGTVKRLLRIIYWMLKRDKEHHQ